MTDKQWNAVQRTPTILFSFYKSLYKSKGINNENNSWPKMEQSDELTKIRTRNKTNQSGAAQQKWLFEWLVFNYRLSSNLLLRVCNDFHKCIAFKSWIITTAQITCPFCFTIFIFQTFAKMTICGNESSPIFKTSSFTVKSNDFSFSSFVP